MSKKNLVHGIDITAPGGIEMLLDFHRGTFGNATMQADDSSTEEVESNEEVNEDNDSSNDAEANDSGEANEDNDEVAKLKADVDKWKRMSRKNEDNAKAGLTKIAELENKISKFESDSNDFNKLKEDYSNLLKKSVATEFGLTEFIDRLRGNTEEELRADAETFKALIPAVKKTVQPVFKQGTDSDANFGSVTFSSIEEHKKYLKNN